jgi:hypothetical protein
MRKKIAASSKGTGTTKLSSKISKAPFKKHLSRSDLGADFSGVYSTRKDIITHATMLMRLGEWRIARQGGALLQLQRDFGNRYVQRLLQTARWADAQTDVAPKIGETIERSRDGARILQMQQRSGNSLFQRKRARRGHEGRPMETAPATSHLRSGRRISRHGGPLAITSLAVTNATATAADPNTYVTTTNAAAGNVVIEATLDPAHGPADLADHNVRWRGGRPGANGLQRIVPIRAARRNRVRLTVDGSSSSVTIYVVNSTPPPAANPPTRLVHTLAGRSNPGRDFGLTVVTIGQQGVRRPGFDIVAHLNGNQWQFRVLEIGHRYRVGVSSQGRRDISGPGDSDIRPNTIAQIIADLTPPAAGAAHGPPRARFWSRRISRAHEEAHVTHFYNTPAFWPAQMAAFEAEVESLNVNFDPGRAATRSANSVLRAQRAHWQTRIADFHNLADAAEIPTSEVFCHGVSNPMYTALLASIANTVAPPAPRNLVTAATSPTTVDLTWAHDHVNETGFVIERQQGRGPYTPIANVGTPPARFTDTGLQPNTRYSYRIAAASPAGSSPVSRRATIRTPP